MFGAKKQPLPDTLERTFTVGPRLREQLMAFDREIQAFRKAWGADDAMVLRKIRKDAIHILVIPANRSLSDKAIARKLKAFGGDSLLLSSR